FVLKGDVFREAHRLAAAIKARGFPVKWIEDRNEHLIASGQAREETVEVQAAVKNDGTVLGMKVKMLMDQGAYPGSPFPAAMFTSLVQMLFPGPYTVKGFTFDVT